MYMMFVISLCLDFSHVVLGTLFIYDLVLNFHTFYFQISFISEAAVIL